VKRAIALAAVLAALLPLPARSDQLPQSIGHAPLLVRAGRVQYFSDAAVVQARDAVHVALPDGASVDGDAATVDLRLRRLTVAGHVRLHTSGGDYDGAGFAYFFAFRRAYFVPLVPSADRWTFLDDHWDAPEKGREMPGDAFALPDLGAVRPYITGRSAEIDLSTYLKFTPASVLVFDTVSTPALPAYVYNFSANQDFGVNSLAGASFDAPYAFAGSATTLDALHLRYDQAQAVKTYWSFEHHSVFGDGGYAVFSLNPASRPAKQWNLISYEPAGSRAAFAVDAQLFTTQSGLSEPSSSSGFLDAQWTQALAQSALRLDLTQSYGTFVASGPPNHPFVAGLQWTGYDQPLGRSGLTFRLQSGFASVHDALGVSGSLLPDVWSHYLGAYAATPVYDAPLGLGVDATVQYQRTWLSFPNTVDVTTATLAASKRITNKIFGIASLVMSAASTGDVSKTFALPNSASGLVPAPTSPNGLPVLGVATIVPKALNRSYALTASWQPSPAFQFTGSAQKTDYFPVQAPGIAGPPRYQFDGDVRFRLTSTLFADLSRSYFFNWGGRTWSPQFGLQVSAQ
jgi:hypothetical protein